MAPDSSHAPVPAQAPVKQQLWSFDPAHPALAERHYLRTACQDEALKKMQAKEEADQLRLQAQAAARSPHRHQPAAPCSGPARLRPGSASAAARAWRPASAGVASSPSVTRQGPLAPAGLEQTFPRDDSGKRGGGGSGVDDVSDDEAAFKAGYDSDLEREAAAREAAKSSGQRAAEAAERRRRAAMDEEEARRARWLEENAWMDAYRSHPRHTAPGAAAAPGPCSRRPTSAGLAAAASTGDEREDDRDDGLGAAAADTARAAALSPADEALLRRPFMPIVSQEFPHYAVAVDALHEAAEAGGAAGLRFALDAASGSGGASSGGRRPGSAPQFRTTVARPFGFEGRALSRPQLIASVKAEQDRELRRREEAAVRRIRFKANPVPPSTLEPRYDAILAGQAARREAGHSQSMAALTATEQPFSFYTRDQDREAQREQQRRAAKDPSRFQRPFKAAPIPKHVGERLFDAMRVDEEARRLAARVRAEMARERARERLEETWKARQAAAAAAYRERLMGTGPPSATATPRRHSAASLPDGDTACRPATGPQRRRPRSAAQQAWKGAPRRVNGRVVSQPVPDFASLHSAWERRLAAAKESNQRRATVPQEFNLNGSTREEQATREARAAERRARIADEAADDKHQLPESRWTFTGPRAPVTPTPPPSAAAAGGGGARGAGAAGRARLEVGDTLAARLKREATRRALNEGRYESEEARASRRADEERSEARDAAKRAAAVRSAAQRYALAEKLQSAALAVAAGLAPGATAEPVAGGAEGGAGVSAPSSPSGRGSGHGESEGRSGSRGRGLTSTAEWRRRAEDVAAFGAAARSRSPSPRPPSRGPSGPAAVPPVRHGRGGGGGSSSGTSERRASLRGRREAPVMHIEARHAQAAAQAHRLVEDALLAQGIDALRYVKG
ncbi:hypothetical protein MNEG_0552 [Monoraphidium neglectum]|uniref:Uncharacterized protein n=1 Tax=Monoraphidium neglectum TaxID=145388 RepID=A0A0D2KAY5_9CHLO|nr:hypothetical protein MNEG_0552 [Monoraphidium neglectum]KIZ07398.1 hypothetical protein MNEG_0552 [Monoraphidium neglectum]|eukprot:XP_013906417.1 hypothetical protein MNEG_0552 [Monoraphidium neglectum]